MDGLGDWIESNAEDIRSHSPNMFDEDWEAYDDLNHPLYKATIKDA